LRVPKKYITLCGIQRLLGYHENLIGTEDSMAKAQEKIRVLCFPISALFFSHLKSFVCFLNIYEKAAECPACGRGLHLFSKYDKMNKSRSGG